MTSEENRLDSFRKAMLSFSDYAKEKAMLKDFSALLPVGSGIIWALKKGSMV